MSTFRKHTSKNANELSIRQRFDNCTKDLLEILKELDNSSEVESLSKDVKSFVRDEIRFFETAIENYTWKISKSILMNSNF